MQVFRFLIERVSLNLGLVALLAGATLLLPGSAWATDVAVDCTGATPGAFTSLQSAIDSLDYVGPHTITMIAGPCVENVLIFNRQRITIQQQVSGFGVTVISPNPGANNAVRVFGSTGIVFTEVGFANSFNGLVVDRNSEVQALGCTMSGNANSGIVVRGHSVVRFAGHP